MKLSLNLIFMACYVVVSVACLPVPTHSGTKVSLKSFGKPVRNHQLYTSMMKIKSNGSKLVQAGRSRSTSVNKDHKKKSHLHKAVQSKKASKGSQAPKKSSKGSKAVESSKASKKVKHILKAVKTSGKQRMSKLLHLKLKFKGKYSYLGRKPVPKVITPEIAAIRRTLAERFYRKMSKRSPLDSPLATLLGTASSTASSLPVVGVPLTSLLSSLPTNSLAAPGALSGLLGTLTSTAQSAPVLGDLLKMLPLSSLLKGNPLDGVKSTLSGLFVAIPVLGGPLSGLAGAATGATSLLPISLFDLGSAAPASSQRTVTGSESTDNLSQSTPLANLLKRSLSSRSFIAAREH
ncbi:hypothetical protein KEM48_001545 [Puccinia striiformis f. sp. tritici PST-130]|nr:hypothetical protein Pst134EB_001330 [Puccinia striiformis f. sp. tritici]KAI9607535.1 hypothetical protein KEM48_001545 [Puccinia striiformis f. sp. tritici PST-130]